MTPSKITINLEWGKSGLWFVTSPNAPGLLTSEKTVSKALHAAGDAIAALIQATAESLAEGKDVRTVLREAPPPLTPQIASEIYGALERLDTSEDLLSIIGSYGDSLDDSEVLKLLKDYNATWKVIHERQ